MSNCSEYAEALDLYVDGELSGEEMETVRAHLAVCPDCQAYVDDALALRAAFPNVEETPVPKDFAQSVMAALPPRSATPASSPRKTVWLKTLVPLAACAAVVLLVQGGSLHMAATPQDAGAPQAAPFSLEESAAADAAPAEGAGAPESNASTATAEAPKDAVPRLSAAQALVETPALTLTADEVGELLADYTPIEESDAALCYELSAQQFEKLTAALVASGILSTEEVPTPSDGPMLVTVQK